MEQAVHKLGVSDLTSKPLFFAEYHKELFRSGTRNGEKVTQEWWTEVFQYHSLDCGRINSSLQQVTPSLRSALGAPPESRLVMIEPAASEQDLGCTLDAFKRICLQARLFEDKDLGAFLGSEYARGSHYRFLSIEIDGTCVGGSLLRCHVSREFSVLLVHVILCAVEEDLRKKRLGSLAIRAVQVLTAQEARSIGLKHVAVYANAVNEPGAKGVGNRFYKSMHFLSHTGETQTQAVVRIVSGKTFAKLNHPRHCLLATDLGRTTRMEWHHSAETPLAGGSKDFEQVSFVTGCMCPCVSCYTIDHLF